MVMAFELSQDLGLAPEGDAHRLRNHLAAVGLPTDLNGLADGSWSADRLLDHMALDKKALAGRLTFILARGIGQAFIADDVDRADVRRVLDRHLAAVR